MAGASRGTCAGQPAAGAHGRRQQRGSEELLEIAHVVLQRHEADEFAVQRRRALLRVLQCRPVPVLCNGPGRAGQVGRLFYSCSACRSTVPAGVLGAHRFAFGVCCGIASLASFIPVGRATCSDGTGSRKQMNAPNADVRQPPYFCEQI